ncbi:MAG: Mu transposase C-terminal domain-containing protein [Zoogloea sp.]|uniref:Mu transposase C-terminal domain-containing protein n=1 Tax=Zoogloea sp. TaxID=49181 RepID=UPI00261A90EB|nr:Mu transposase C-terminal domain-containing protein [Zoogloea sp.]MDD3325654.1 Mu transposase C-terminal domain-containing protein [Zoogloea sp.]
METELMWLSVSQLAELAEIASQNARSAMKKCFETEGSTWRGARLTVRMADAAGGPGGKAYQVQANSLPLELYQKFRDQNPALFQPAQLPATTKTVNPDVDLSRVSLLVNHRREAEWKAELIEPALRWRAGSSARVMALRQLADQTHIRPTDGKPVTFSVETLRKFCTDFEAGGVEALTRKPRAREAAHRYLVNRKWDDACPLDVSEKTRIAKLVEQYVVDLWANGAPSRDKVRNMASARLFELCREAGWAGASLKLCDVGQYLVERNQDVRDLATRSKDAKRFSDKYKPRVARTREGFAPGEAIVADVHPVDILLRRADGSTYTARMIAWYDLGTNRFFYTLLHPGPRQSVTQADIARSFFELCQAWGIPRKLYLDNGSEYKWGEMMDAFRLFAVMVQEMDVRIESIEALEARFAAEDAGEEVAPDETPGQETAVTSGQDAVVRAKPYNAAAKPVEGAFSALEKFLSMLPGYIGGDRMNKRLSRVGKQPDTYPGDAEAFGRDFDGAVESYHNAPQRGFLKGLTPNQKAEIIPEGYVVTYAPEIVFRVAFAEERTPKVHNGGIQLDGRWYYDDALIPYATRKVTVRFAKWAPDAVILVRDRALPGLSQYALIRERQVFGMFDPAGAIEASRREGVQSRHYRALKKQQRVGKLDMADELHRYNRVHQTLAEERKAEAGHALPKVRQIGMNDEMQALQAQLESPNQNPVERLGAGEIMDKKGDIHRLPTREEALKERDELRKAQPKIAPIECEIGPRSQRNMVRESNLAIADKALEEARKRRKSDR